MAVVERHTTPDGQFELIVILDDRGDWVIGFEGCGSHTHGDLLTELYGSTPEAAVRSGSSRVSKGRRVVAM